MTSKLGMITILGVLLLLLATIPVTSFAQEVTPTPDGALDETPTPTPIPTPTPTPASTPTPTATPVASPPPPPAPQNQEPVGVGTSSSCVLREGMQVRLQNVVDTITTSQDGHIELSFRNPPVNDCTVEADLRITVPQNIIPLAKEGAISGTASTLNAFVEAPEGSERSLKMDFKGQEVGEYFISFSGTYWPKGNKDRFQPITLQQKLTVESQSDPDTIPVDPVITPPVPTSPATAPAPTSAPPPTTATDDFPLDTWLIVLIVLVVLVVIVAIVALGRRGGGGRTTVIRD